MPSAGASDTPAKVMTTSMPIENASVTGSNPRLWGRAMDCEGDHAMSRARMRRTPVRRQVRPNCRLGAGERIPPAPACRLLDGFAGFDADSALAHLY